MTYYLQKKKDFFCVHYFVRASLRKIVNCRDAYIAREYFSIFCVYSGIFRIFRTKIMNKMSGYCANLVWIKFIALVITPSGELFPNNTIYSGPIISDMKCVKFSLCFFVKFNVVVTSYYIHTSKIFQEVVNDFMVSTVLLNTKRESPRFGRRDFYIMLFLGGIPTFFN